MNIKRLKAACYTTNITMSVIGNLPPLLLLTFRELYSVPYTLLGLLVLINFVTQLGVDLLFSFFSHKFNIPLTVKLTPLLAAVGLGIYALLPTVFPDVAFAGLVVGTIIFSAASGLGEVLMSPVIAALPSEDPDREMSKLHSVYAWGVVGVIMVSTAYLLLFSNKVWQGLAVLFMLIPLTSFCLFLGAKVPDMERPQRLSGTAVYLKNKGMWLCVFAIFLGGAAECTMAQWGSGYLEKALGIEKVWGDVFGVAMFAVMLGLGRTLYAKYGKNVEKVILLGGVGAFLCYLTAALSDVALIGLIACGLTGLCTSMLWPGNLVVAAGRFPTAGVFIYAMMAAGGDLGAALSPQLVGAVTDVTMSVSSAATLAARLGITVEQLGMKAGMLLAALFPLMAIFVYYRLLKTKNKNVYQEIS